MKKFAVIDCETDPFLLGRIPKPFLWGYYDGVSFRYYTQDTAKLLFDDIIQQDLIIYAHNGGRFDYHFLLDMIEPYDDIKIINGRIALFTVGNAEFRDSYNILPVPLKKFELVDTDGTIIKKQEFDYSRMEPGERHKPENWAEIVDYLKDDCITLYKAIEAFQGEYGRHLTQAGAALSQWKKISKKPVPESTPEFFDTFKPFYYGGRVQCFKLGIVEIPFSVYDINSAYPRAMMDSHPYGLEFITSEIELSEYAKGSAFFVLRARSTGAFPYREKTGLTFPDDGEVREFRITGWELIAAEETGTLKDCEILNIYYFPALNSFSDYIEYFYQKRLTAKATNDKAGDLFAKLLMNSLYGKFGSNPENYKSYMVAPKSDFNDLLEDDTYTIGGELGPWLLAQRELTEEELKFFNVATAASITGYVRAFLWRALHSTGLENALYCDTDSIATASENCHVLDTGDKLGQWKHEGEFLRAGIGGKKMYIFEPKSGKPKDYKTASKGVKLTNAELWAVAKGKEVCFYPDAPTFSVHKKPEFVKRRIKLTR